MVSLEKGLELWSILKDEGFKGDLVGGAFKGKSSIHDLDLLCLDKYTEYNSQLVKEVKKSNSLGVPIELYYCTSTMYPGLKKALRSTTYENIKGKLMKGLRYRRSRL